MSSTTTPSAAGTTRPLRETVRRMMAGAAIGASLVIVADAERDLRQRLDSDVRGDKRIWRLVCLNAIGAAIYLQWGHRSETESS
jgi:hypothetical protein